MISEHRVRVSALVLVGWVGTIVLAGLGRNAMVWAADAATTSAGNALLEAKNYLAAEAAFRKGTAADPNDTKALEGLVTALDKQGKYGEEATVAEHMADVFEKQANQAAAAPANPPAALPAAPAVNGDKDAEIAALKRKLAEMKAAKTPPAGPAMPDHSAPAEPQAPGATAAAQAPDKTPLLALEKSDLVTKDPKGALLVADKTGRGVDGIKLSQHDRGIASPSIAVAPDGTIHVAFVETNSTAPAIYHRSSSDGGKTWSEAKNLTEDLPKMQAGRCEVLADARNRVYVVFRADGCTDLRGCRCSLWFRELEGGKWTKAKPVSHMTLQPGAGLGSAPPRDGQPIDGMANGVPNYYESAYSFFAVVDAAGRAQVVWNALPAEWHPELSDSHGPSLGAGNGLVFQSTLDGASAGKPREVFLPVVTTPPHGLVSCDGLDMLNGYVDSAGAAHFVALATMPGYGLPQHPPRHELIENGKAGQSMELPPLTAGHAWCDIPRLLVDAKGKQHMIASYMAGEHPNVRDYTLGSEEEPTVIRPSVGLNGGVMGFQAYQGPGGRMVIFLQMNDTGEMHSGDNFVSMSTGDGKWSVPINMTNNAGRKTFHNTQTSAQSNLGEITACIPGVCASAFDKDGHLLVLLIKGEYKIVIATALGVNTAGGDVTIPTLRFLKF